MKKWLPKKTQANADRKSSQRKTFRKVWEAEKDKDPTFGAVFKKTSRDHNARHKGAKVELIDTLNRNGRRSFCSLEKAINNWCSYKTIEWFLKSNADFETYSQNVRPLMSEGNR
jgi:hypothetical protein